VTSDLKDPNSKNNSATATTRVIEAGSPTWGGHRATIVGTPGADMLAGSAGNDVIFAGAGNDRIRSLGGGSDLRWKGQRRGQIGCPIRQGSAAAWTRSSNRLAQQATMAMELAGRLSNPEFIRKLRRVLAG
jgi:Ca2+-binding RTX toxin-like protein